MSVSESSYSGSCSRGFLTKENMQNSLLMLQMRLEEEMQTISDPCDRKEAIFNYMRNVTAGPPIICDDFTSGLDWINVDGNVNVSLNAYQDQIVVLDFFTYCCINCLHILPTLKRLETLYEHTKRFEVIGVHSAKFNNEKILENVLDAVRRHNITHKVVSDPQARLWTQMNISCWPTVLVLGPKNQLLFSLIGENNVFEYLPLYCEAALQFFYPHLCIQNAPAPPRPETRRLFSLFYPTKLAISPDHTKLAIADCGNHRIVIVDFVNEISTFVGGPHSGNMDGCFQVAKFNNPQGLSWSGNDRLFVADTGNNALKQCSFDDDMVITLCTNSTDRKFTSPWDITLVHGVLYIACAGSHQIFAYALDEGYTVFGKAFLRCKLMCIAGTGLEENRNNMYPAKASFAQPSGICYSEKNNCLLIADSESSTLRTLSFSTGQVKNLVGGTIDPLDLFTFGDKDGQALEVRLQHPMGITCNDEKNCVLFVDTFNHKVKEVDIASRTCKTIAGTGEAGNCFACQLPSSQFNEPNGICYSSRDGLVYVADTNNHQVKVIDLSLGSVTVLKLNFIKKVTTENTNKVVKELPLLTVSKGNTLSFKSNFLFSKDYAPSKNAPHHFRLNVPGESYSWIDLGRSDFPIPDFMSQPVIRIKFTDSTPASTRFTLEGVITVYYCSTTEDFCSFKEVTFKIPLIIDPHDTRVDDYKVELTFELS